MKGSLRLRHLPSFWLSAALLLTCLVYWPGLSGGWLFDDYPSIVENPDIHVHDLGLQSLTNAALSSTTSEFKRPLASLSFALNYRASALDPYWMKLTNLLIHLLNGVLVFLLSRALLCTFGEMDADAETTRSPALNIASRHGQHASITAILIATGWLLLPINLTGVLYVVQRMESLANVFVLLGLLGYVAGRRRMLRAETPRANARGLGLCAASLAVPTALGLLAKETAVMLPLYALLVEWILFRARRAATTNGEPAGSGMPANKPDWHIWILFSIVLVVPMLVGLAWLLPHVIDPQNWATRDFTLHTRLLSEARIILDYIRWTLLPTTHGLKFYYDDFPVSNGWLTPWTTLASVLGVSALAAATLWLRQRLPIAALGLALFLGAHLLTGTILPRELVFEHRNYFASFGLLLALVPLLADPDPMRMDTDAKKASIALSPSAAINAAPMRFAFARHVLLGALLALWTIQTALNAYIWGSPLRLAQELAARSPASPRAQYALGRTYSVYSNHDMASRFTPLAYDALENAARLPGSSILPEQALIYMNALMHMPAKDAWWDSLITKLRGRSPTVQDQSALRALSICAIQKRCDLPKDRVGAAYEAALSHPKPSAQLQARYGDYAWSALGDKVLGERMMASAVQADPNEPDYRVALIRMMVAQGRTTDASGALQQLESLNVGGRLDPTLHKLRMLLNSH